MYSVSLIVLGLFWFSVSSCSSLVSGVFEELLFLSFPPALRLLKALFCFQNRNLLDNFCLLSPALSHCLQIDKCLWGKAALNSTFFFFSLRSGLAFKALPVLISLNSSYGLLASGDYRKLCSVS